MSEPFLGEIRPFPYGFAPRFWAFCSGQLLPINQNQALFSLLGTTYGGNGTTTFALPNLNDRVPIGAGTGPGLSSVNLGEQSGSSSVTLLSTQIPSHNHSVNVAGAGTTTSPVGAIPANSPLHNIYDTAINTTMDPDVIEPAGGNQPHENMQPYLGINFCIALSGIFPSRN